MSPESLLAAALLWGMLRIARRHYATNGMGDGEPQTQSEHRDAPALDAGTVGFRPRATPRFSTAQFASMLLAPGKTRC
jgi:hypothetical protein